MNNLIKQLFFIPKCKLCQKLADEDNLCTECKKKLLQCRISNAGQPINLSVKNISASFASYYYRDAAMEIVKYAKFKNPARFLNSFITDISIDILKIMKENNIDIIVQAPCHKSKLYGQEISLPDEMVKKLSKLGLVTDLTCVKKTRKTSKQHNLSLEKRKVNLINAFEVTGDVTNKNILIIDDVITTGNTISEIAKELKLAGRKDVYAWAYTFNYK